MRHAFDRELAIPEARSPRGDATDRLTGDFSPSADSSAQPIGHLAVSESWCELRPERGRCVGRGVVLAGVLILSAFAIVVLFFQSSSKDVPHRNIDTMRAQPTHFAGLDSRNFLQIGNESCDCTESENGGCSYDKRSDCFSACCPDRRFAASLAGGTAWPPHAGADVGDMIRSDMKTPTMILDMDGRGNDANGSTVSDAGERPNVRDDTTEVVSKQTPPEAPTEVPTDAPEWQGVTRDHAEATPPTTTTTPPATTTPTTIVKPHANVCNASVPLPPMSRTHRWKICPSWRRVCEMKNRPSGKYPFDRNWCWIGMKNACHGNLKKHMSWSAYQDMAASQGQSPSVANAAFHPLENPEICDQPHFGEAGPWTNEQWTAAYKWADENLNIYVLNLKTDTERFRVITARLDVLNIKFTHILGVDMRIPGSMWMAKRAGYVPADFKFEKAQHEANTQKQGMGSILGTLGCASAHFKAATKAILDGKALAVVMEDDSWPEDDFIPRLWSLVTGELPCDWEATALMSRCPYGMCVSPRLARVQPDVNEPGWDCHHGVNWGMHAVLYRVETLPELLRKWKAVVFDEKRPQCMDVDVALASISGEVGFYAVPAVQKPGFLREGDLGSSRWTINVQNANADVSR